MTALPLAWKKKNCGKIRLWYRGVYPDFTHHSVQKNAFKICPSPARYLQSGAPHQAFKHSAGTNSSGMSKAKVLCVFALQTSWAMWEENGCRLLGLINKEHADVQFGRICFWWSLHGKWIWRKTTERGCWRWEVASQLTDLTVSEFLFVLLRMFDSVHVASEPSLPWRCSNRCKQSSDSYPSSGSLTILGCSGTTCLQMGGRMRAVSCEQMFD